MGHALVVEHVQSGDPREPLQRIESFQRLDALQRLDTRERREPLESFQPRKRVQPLQGLEPVELGGDRRPDEHRGQGHHRLLHSHDGCHYELHRVHHSAPCVRTGPGPAGFAVRSRSNTLRCSNPWLIDCTSSLSLLAGS